MTRSRTNKNRITDICLTWGEEPRGTKTLGGLAGAREGGYRLSNHENMGNPLAQASKFYLLGLVEMALLGFQIKRAQNWVGH